MRVPPLLLKIGVPVLLVILVVAGVLLTRPQLADGTAAGVWTCSMHPQIRQPQPGRCPICGMELVPVGQLAQEQARLAEQAGIATEEIKYRELFKEIRTVGKLDYAERRIAYITARIAGRIERVYADFPGIQVKKGDHLVDIYSPELLVTVQNLLDAVQRGNQDLAEMSRDRLRFWGILPEQIRAIEKTGRWKPLLTIHAPIGGTVIEKAVREGQYVKEGDMLYRIADLDPLWLYLDIYEYDLAWVRYGQSVEVTIEAYPGETFRGTVVFIDPFLNDQTRTVKVRVNLPNPQGKLKPALYASAVLRVRLQADGTPEPTGLEGKYLCPMHPEIVRDQPGRCPLCEMPLERIPDTRPPSHTHTPPHTSHGGEPAKVLAVPVSAVLDTGRRKIAYRQTPEGNYELVELQVGPRAEGKNDAGKTVGYFPVRAGLKAGDRVVVRGGFLLDSQAQIEGRPSLLYPEGRAPAALHGEHGAMPAPKAPTKGEIHKH
ncbi:MAG TPA: efflux RND transporter periplasmic adaptor subunit [Gemmataceae bacterium]|nr:efflux RND transporter periplasmic adaptor subunit [Gemmataceae bacterium]